MEIYPPDDAYLLNLDLFGLPIAIRWYGVLIMAGALLSAYVAANRARLRNHDPEHVWNLLMLGLVLGIAGARAYYVAFEWPRFAGRPLLDIINPATGGLAIHGALIGAIAAALIYTRRNRLGLIEWLDICLPTVLLAQAVGRWGNFFNQEAYGRPSELGFGLVIDAEHRVEPFRDMQAYPRETTLFHPTFLYESIWNLVGFGLLIWIERRFGKRLRPGDMALGYAIVYGAGRFWIEGLRTDSLCTSGVGGGCDESLRVAQIASLFLLIGGVVGVVINHLRRTGSTEEPGNTSTES
ncbi:MAG TPA: prolipoprotein diacylglyceryl transferase [Roseiflexaceae bacterium]|nr:prolipoprotein diacylglyceryl transferase [Roseiflexaceae bacterium]HMP40383.1 prolipoprotein diacylglyceryl transferase [Roseiflexaceae bacterium]